MGTPTCPFPGEGGVAHSHVSCRGQLNSRVALESRAELAAWYFPIPQKLREEEERLEVCAPPPPGRRSHGRERVGGPYNFFPRACPENQLSF